MTLDASTVLLVLLGAIVIDLTLVIHLEARMNRLLRGKSGKSVESMVVKNAADIGELKKFRAELGNYLAGVEKRLKRSIGGVGTVRFNPFKGAGEGGNQSFASAFIDEHKDGVVLSTLRSRERVSVFAKPLKNGMAEIELTPEEREAVRLAEEKLH